jgi:hypothetical protein
MDGFASCVNYMQYIPEDDEFDRVTYASDSTSTTEGDPYSAMSYAGYDHDRDEFGYYTSGGSWHQMNAKTHLDSAMV